MILSLIGFWIIDNIPGSYDNHDSQEMALSELLISTKQYRLPLFYFGFIPEISDSIYSIQELLPHWRWNGTNNQFHQWLTQSSYSLRDGQGVSFKIVSAIKWSFVFMFPALFIILIVGLFLSEWSVKRPNSQWTKWLIRVLSFFHSIPVFWLASLLLLFFASVSFLNWFPASISGSDIGSAWELLSTKIYYLILPLLSMILPTLSIVCSLSQKKYMDIMQSASWKRMLSSGITVDQGLRTEARPHVILVLLAWIASAIPLLIGGSIIIETIFSIPGTGRLLHHSITIRDWPVVHGIFMLSATLTIFGITISDWLQRRIDIRINTV